MYLTIGKWIPYKQEDIGKLFFLMTLSRNGRHLNN